MIFIFSIKDKMLPGPAFWRLAVWVRAVRIRSVFMRVLWFVTMTDAAVN